MAWIYLAESVALVSPSEDTWKQSPIVKQIDTLRLYYCPECEIMSWTEPQSAPMCENCKESISEILESTSSLEASPVRTSVLQEMEKAWQESEVDFSSTLLDWSKKSSPVSSFWKTCQPLELVVFSTSSAHLPKSGMTVAGLVYQPQALELHINAKDGSYLPTPTNQSYGTNQGGAAGRTGMVRMSLETMARKNLWPAQTARDWKDNGKNPSELNRNSTTLATIAGGKLNPQWVEWLMGYRCGWTELGVLETQWFRHKSKKRLRG